MTFKISKLSLLFFIFVSSGSFAQFRFDTGIKVSSLDQERFLLEQRFHLEKPYTLVATYAFGSQASNFYNSEVNILDSTLNTYSSNYYAQTHTLKFGVQREISWLASDVFYLGGNVGFGYRQYQRSIVNSAFALHDSTALNPPHFHGDYEEISTSVDWKNTDVILAQLGITFGMDVPLTKRLLINVELGLLYNFGSYLGQRSLFSEMVPALSGGLRYQFGKRG